MGGAMMAQMDEERRETMGVQDGMKAVFKRRVGSAAGLPSAGIGIRYGRRPARRPMAQIAGL